MNLTVSCWRSGVGVIGCSVWRNSGRASHRIAAALFALVGMLLILSSCDAPRDSDRIASAAQVDTLEDGTVRVRNAARGIWTDGERWWAEEVFRLGERDGTGPEVFGEIRGMAADSRGRLYVADSQAEMIRVFGREGEYVRTLGRPGQGPGELALLRGVAIDESDRAWALDGGNFRYAVWDSNGALVGTEERPFPHLPRVLNGNAEGDRLVEFTGGLFEGADGRRRYGFVRVALGDTPVDSFPGPQPPSPERFRVQPDPGGMAFVFPVPFTPEFHLTVGPDGRYWTGMSDSYRFHEVTLEGDTTRILEREFTLEPITDAEIEAALDHEQLEHIRNLGGELDLDRIPRTKPVLQWISVDDQGYVWVGLFPDADGRTPVDVFDPEGRYLGQVPLPVQVLSDPVPVVRGRSIWATVRDEFDVQYVVKFRIEGS